MEEGDLRWCCGSSSSNDWDLDAVVRFATGSCSGGCRVVTSPRAWDESLFSGSGVPLPPPQSQQDEATDAPALQQLTIGGPAVDDDFWADYGSVPQPRNEEAPPQKPPAKPRSKRKKKKSQMSNKEVTRVPVGASPPDPWAWRKYGQKPIKGSPYPRGYYRCSTDKDCRARKQVERCRTDPSTLIVSYTGGEHSHPVPLHRSALAGTTRNKPQWQPASSTSTAEQPDPAAVSLSPIDTSTPLLLCPSVGVEYEEDNSIVAASLLLEDAEMEVEEDVLSFLKPTPPSPTNGSGSKQVTQLRQLPLPGTTSSSRTADGSWAVAPAAMNATHEIEMCPF